MPVRSAYPPTPIMWRSSAINSPGTSPRDGRQPSPGTPDWLPGRWRSPQAYPGGSAGPMTGRSGDMTCARFASRTPATCDAMITMNFPTRLTAWITLRSRRWCGHWNKPSGNWRMNRTREFSHRLNCRSRGNETLISLLRQNLSLVTSTPTRMKFKGGRLLRLLAFGRSNVGLGCA